MRKSYMTMCFYGNTEATYIVKDGDVVMTYEKAVMGGFNRADITLDGEVLIREGFEQSEVDYFVDFTLRNAPVIQRLVSEDIPMDSTLKSVRLRI